LIFDKNCYRLPNQLKSAFQADLGSKPNPYGKRPTPKAELATKLFEHGIRRRRQL
jgi:hypothetical protein